MKNLPENNQKKQQNPAGFRGIFYVFGKSGFCKFSLKKKEHGAIII